MHGDDEPYGSVHRVELFDEFPRHALLTDVVGIMNRAATEDVRSPVWPVVSRVLRSGPAPSARDRRRWSTCSTTGCARDAPRLDADEDGLYDEAGPAIMDALWRPLAEAVMRPVFGDLVDDLDAVRSLGGLSGESYVDKDLRTLLGDRVRGPFNLRYCGGGSLAECRASLWSAVDAGRGRARRPAGRARPGEVAEARGATGFVPGLLPNTFPTTNRPTFQQVLELERHGP